MKKRHSIKPVTLHLRKQAGDALLDAMIAMVLAMVVGLGPMYVASRGAVVQTQASYQNMAVVEMRKLLATQGPALCGTTPQITVNRVDAASGDPAVLDLAVAVTCSDRPATGITIGGVSVDPTLTGAAKTVSLSVTSSTKFGGSGTITITQGGA